MYIYKFIYNIYIYMCVCVCVCCNHIKLNLIHISSYSNQWIKPWLKQCFDFCLFVVSFYDFTCIDYIQFFIYKDFYVKLKSIAMQNSIENIINN